METKTSQYFLFKDLVHNAIKDGQIKFADKGKVHMQIGVDSLQVEAHYSDPLQINMLEVAVEDSNGKGVMTMNLSAKFER